MTTTHSGIQPQKDMRGSLAFAGNDNGGISEGCPFGSPIDGQLYPRPRALLSEATEKVFMLTGAADSEFQPVHWTFERRERIAKEGNLEKGPFNVPEDGHTTLEGKRAGGPADIPTSTAGSSQPRVRPEASENLTQLQQPLEARAQTKRLETKHALELHYRFCATMHIRPSSLPHPWRRLEAFRP